MKNITIDVWTFLPFIFLLFFYSVFSLQITSSLVPIIRFALFGVIFIIFLLIIIHKKVEPKKTLFFLPAILFEIYYILRNTSPYANKAFDYAIFYQAMLFILLFIILSISWKKIHIFYFSLASVFIYLLVVYHTPQNMNENSIGAYSYYLSFFPLIYIVEYSKHFTRLKILVLLVISSIVIYFSDTRSIFLCVISGFITFLFWKFLSKSKLWFRFYFLLTLTLVLFFTFFYPMMNVYVKNFYYYNNLSVQYTGKNLYSGRQIIWEKLIKIINLKPIFGFGSGALPTDFLNNNLSAHNLYIQIALQTGLLGVGLLIIFLIIIWNKLWTNRYDKKVIIVACYLIGIVIHQTFEVSLTQNNLTLALFQWVILGFGLSYCFNKKKADLI